MRKNYFKNLVTSTMMLLAMALGFTSCEGTLDDIFGEWSRPTQEPAIVITPTSSGASVKVNNISNLTEALSSLKDQIAASSGSEYVIDVTSSLESTSGANEITVPLANGSKVKLNFTNSISTTTPLTIKSESTATTPSAAKNELTIELPSSSNGKAIDLNVDMPETSVTLKATSGSVVYNEIVAKTAVNTLYIESGVTVKFLQVKGGRVIVKNGGAIETYVHSSDGYIMRISSDGVEPKYMPGVTADGNEDPNNPVREITKENGNPYYCQNLKVIKGSEEVTFIEHNINKDNLFKKLIIGDGAAVNYKNGDDIRIETIEGEGNARFLYGVSYLNYDTDEMLYFGNIDLYLVKNLSGVTFSPLWKDKVGHNSTIWDVPQFTTNCKFEACNIGCIGWGTKNCTYEAEEEINMIFEGAENCTFTGKWLYFQIPDNPTASFKNCKFNLTGENEYKIIYFTAPAQSSSITSFTWNFTNCEFDSEIRISTSMDSSKPRLDENGKVVCMDEYVYWVKSTWYDGEQEYIGWYNNFTTDFNEVPQEAKDYGEVDGEQFWNGDHNGYMVYKDQPQYDPVEFNNYVVRFAFDGCKTGSSAITSSNFPHDYFWAPDGTKLYYAIDGTDYEPQWDEEGNFILVQPGATTRGAYNRAYTRAQYMPSYIKTRYHQAPKRH